MASNSLALHLGDFTNAFLKSKMARHSRCIFPSGFAPPDSLGLEHKLSWHHTCLRVCDADASIKFYQRHFGMTLLHDKKVSRSVGPLRILFLGTLRNGESCPPSGTDDADKFISSYSGTLLALRFAESDRSRKVNNGNVEPYRGFGHIAFNCNDVYASCQKLETNGVKFQKRPDEGRMKGLAFALDPDGYWIEIVGRGETVFPEEYNLSQTMIRVKDPKKSIRFYRDVLGMTLIREMHMSDFSNYFLAMNVCPEVPADDPNAKNIVHKLWNPCLELTHNHGTESDSSFFYHNGNEEPCGFSHLGFLAKDVEQLVQKINQIKFDMNIDVTYSVPFQQATITDCDGYTIRIHERNLVLL